MWRKIEKTEETKRKRREKSWNLKARGIEGEGYWFIVEKSSLFRNSGPRRSTWHWAWVGYSRCTQHDASGPAVQSNGSPHPSGDDLFPGLLHPAFWSQMWGELCQRWTLFVHWLGASLVHMVAGGSWCIASPVRPDFSMLPLLSKPSRKWRRWGPTTLWSDRHCFWPWQHSPEYHHITSVCVWPCSSENTGGDSCTQLPGPAAPLPWHTPRLRGSSWHEPLHSGKVWAESSWLTLSARGKAAASPREGLSSAGTPITLMGTLMVFLISKTSWSRERCIECLLLYHPERFRMPSRYCSVYKISSHSLFTKICFFETQFSNWNSNSLSNGQSLHLTSSYVDYYQSRGTLRYLEILQLWHSCTVPLTKWYCKLLFSLLDCSNLEGKDNVGTVTDISAPNTCIFFSREWPPLYWTTMVTWTL